MKKPAKKAMGQAGEMAQGQKSADVKRFSLGYPHRAISGNWPTVQYCSARLLRYATPVRERCLGNLANRDFGNICLNLSDL